MSRGKVFPSIPALPILIEISAVPVSSVLLPVGEVVSIHPANNKHNDIIPVKIRLILYTPATIDE
jgi:hypothetical protein